MDASSLPIDKKDGTVALVKSGSDKIKSSPAGEYLTAALNDFDPDQNEGLAAISDGANKLLMLVCLLIAFWFSFLRKSCCINYHNISSFPFLILFLFLVCAIVSL